MPPANDSADHDGKDGPIDRLAKRLFASPDSPFTAFADRQRLERLESCQQLGRILEACQAAKRREEALLAGDDGQQLSKSKAAEIDVVPSKSGARISRFFGWSSPNSSERESAHQSTEEATTSSVFSEAASSFTNGGAGGSSDAREDRSKVAKKKKSQFSKDCAIETHELWACKALALGCGGYLGDLRRCWSGESKAAGSDGIEYHNEKETSCRRIQMDMARCVNKNAAELEERMKAAKQ